MRSWDGSVVVARQPGGYLAVRGAPGDTMTLTGDSIAEANLIGGESCRFLIATVGSAA